MPYVFYQKKEALKVPCGIFYECTILAIRATTGDGKVPGYLNKDGANLNPFDYFYRPHKLAH